MLFVLLYLAAWASASNNILHSEIRGETDAPCPESLGSRAIRANNNGQRGVLTLDWHTDVLDELRQLREPVLLRSTPASRWPSMLWTPAVLANLYEDTSPLTVYKLLADGEPFLYSDAEKPLTSFVKPPRSIEKTSLTMQELVGRVVQEENADRLYMTIELGSLIKDDATHYANLINACRPAGDFLFSLKHSANLWIGSANITAQTHYDAYHNFNIQLSGRKRWHLYTPSAATVLYPFPYLHPSARHSQVDFENYNFTRFSRAAKADRFMREVTTEPGDVLYIPPFWFHRVKSLAPSINVNVWSDSEDMQLVSTASSQPLPFEESWIFRATNADQDDCLILAEHFMVELYRQRYATTRIRLQGVTVSTKKLELCGPRRSSDGFASALVTVTRYVPEIAGPLRDLPDGVREICVSNMVEEVLNWAVGPQLVGVFLKKCFG